MRDARSHAGAVGLMQLLPNTARRVARKEGIERLATPRLLDPRTNIRLGTRYLGDLVKRFGHPLLAIASYNAGPHRVEKWLPREAVRDATLWVESIPFQETRNYVKRIAYYRVIYARMLDKPVRMSDFFEPVDRVRR